MREENDWRLRNQEDYLKNKKNKTLIKVEYRKPSEKWDHDHCAFCWATFSEYDGDLHEGYCTTDKLVWICKECFEDFKDMFKWKTE